MKKKKKIKIITQLADKIRTSYFEPQISNPFAEASSPFSYQKESVDNSETANTSEIPLSERTQFMHKKMEESETSKRQNCQQETLKQGIICALSDLLFTISKLKKQQQNFKEKCESCKKFTLKLSTDFEQIKLKNEQLEKEIRQYKKEIKKLHKEIKDIKQIVLLQSTYAKVCSKNTPFDELVSEWKHACKHSKKKE